MRRTVLFAVAASLAVWAVICPQAEARIKLTTLPERERTEIQLDNPAATLVEEERIVTLLEGANYIDFAWSNTAIDKSTIQFRVVDMPKRDRREGDHPSLVSPDGRVETIRVINVGFPPGENALVWQVFTEKPLAARVRISYIIANLSRSFSYRALAENDESTLTLWNYIRLDNLSGEDFGDSGVFAGFGNYFRKMIGQNEAKQMLAWRFDSIPVKKTYTFDWWQGARVPDEPDRRYVAMRYVLKNDKMHKMGLFPLQPGKVRIFQKDTRGTEAFTGEDWGRFTPIDEEMKLYLGLARDIEVKRKITRNDRSVVQNTVYDQDVELRYEIKNFKNTPVTLDIVEDMRRLRDELCGGKDHEPEWQIPADGTSIPQPQIERKHSSLVEFHVLAQPVANAAAEPLIVTVHIRLKNEW